MFKEIKKTLEWGGGTLKLSTGKIARQSDGAIIAEMGGTVVLCSAVSAREAKEGIDFFPLTVHYREMAYAAGKIPGGFFKREGKPSEKEVLTSRLIDRPIRPLFHKGFFNETQVICTVLSYDPLYSSDILSIIGASAALALSGAPYLDIVAACRVGEIDGKFVLNPSYEETKESKLDLVLAGTSSSIMMVESEVDFLSEERMLEALEFGLRNIKPVVGLIKELSEEAGKPKMEVSDPYPQDLKNKIESKYAKSVIEAFGIKSKTERNEKLKEIELSVKENFVSEEKGLTENQVKLAFKEVKSDVLRKDVLAKNIRIDGRKPDEVRSIECETALLPKTHGSALFTRGETQALAVTTLGTSQDEQIMDSLEEEYKERFMLNYIFPPYSVGEATPLKPPGRREVGHGKLAWRALNKIIPSKEAFPYTIRLVSEITESNGSSSMATVCGGSMALMDAGVPIKASVGGIAMGLIMEGGKFVVLSDILGDEDHLGDMDFKVAGSREAVTALQMDIKVAGVSLEIMAKALNQAKEGRSRILDIMDRSINKSKEQISEYAPSIESFKIDKEKIREVIGPGGKVIREICESCDAKIDITDDGMVSVSAVGKAKLDAAVARVRDIAFDPKPGSVFDATVSKVIEAGMFVAYSGAKEGFVHISELSDERVKAVSDLFNKGDSVKVKLLGLDNRGRLKFTVKNALKDIPLEAEPEKSPSRPREREAGERPFKGKGRPERRNNMDNFKSEPKESPREEGGSGETRERKYFS